MRVLKAICILFAATFGLAVFSCIYNLFNESRASSIPELLITFVVMAVLTALCVLGAKKTGDTAKENGSGVIVKTKIIDAFGKTSVSSAVARGAVGNMVAGTAGAVIGASTAKNNRSTTFLIFYKSGKKATRTVPNDSLEYRKYIKYLDE